MKTILSRSQQSRKEVVFSLEYPRAHSTAFSHMLITTTWIEWAMKHQHASVLPPAPTAADTVASPTPRYLTIKKKRWPQ
ncbi:hypothetical protein COOONC_12185 [Cooperia oncophora]